MSRHDTLIIKDTHRGLLYEDGVFRDVLPAGRYQIPRLPSRLSTFFGAKGPKVEVILVDVRGRDRTVVVQDLLTADGATITATFVVQFRVTNPQAAVHQVKNFEERLFAEAQTAARRVLRGLSVEEILGCRDEVGEEMLLQVHQAAESCGLEVTGLDFKDLIVPEDLRKLMNRAVAANRRRQIQLVERPAIHDADADLDLDLDDDSPFRRDQEVEDDSDLIIARTSFARAREAELEPEGRYAGGFDGALRRCSP